jgi:peptidoglycan hydrolase-like protein with peptidoglycan-binding domain
MRSRELSLAKNGFHTSVAITIAALGLLGMTLFSGRMMAQTKTGASTHSTKAKPKSSSASAKTGSKSGVRSTKASAKNAKKIPAKQRAQTAPTPERITEIQQVLAREGFYSGTPTGKWDADTSLAMAKFQAANGLTPTGKLGALSLQKLGLGSEIAGKAAPNPQADPHPPVLSETELNAPETKEQ